MTGRPLTDEFDLQRANRNIAEQNELLKTLENEVPFGNPVSFADDVFVKGFGTGLFFMGADKNEILERFGLQPEEEFTQDMNRTSRAGGTLDIETGTITFERHSQQDFRTPTMTTETVDITHVANEQVNPVARLVVTEHALGDVVFTEMRISGAHMQPDELQANIEAMHTMLSDAKKGPVSYDMDADVVTPTDLFGKPESNGQG